MIGVDHGDRSDSTPVQMFVGHCMSIVNVIFHEFSSGLTQPVVFM